MTNLDVLAPNYRRAQQRWPNAPTLAKCYEALAVCFSESTHGLVEHVQSFVESVCRTIIGELDAPLPQKDNPSTKELLRVTLDPLELSNTRRASNLNTVLSGFNKLSEGLGDMRNHLGPVAHGKDGFLDPVSADHARAFLHVGDAILGVLLSAFEGKQPNLQTTREPHASFMHLNDRIDRAVNLRVSVDEDDDRPVVIFSIVTRSSDLPITLRVVPSELLYGVDRQAYIEVLETTELIPVEADEGMDEPVSLSISKAMVEVKPVTTLVPTYSGALDRIRPDLEAFLIAEEVKLVEASNGSDQLVNSLLATVDKNMTLDWKNRENIQARLKVACKRVFIRFGFAAQKADKVAKGMVDWLREQV